MYERHCNAPSIEHFTITFFFSLANIRTHIRRLWQEDEGKGLKIILFIKSEKQFIIEMQLAACIVIVLNSIHFITHNYALQSCKTLNKACCLKGVKPIKES